MQPSPKFDPSELSLNFLWNQSNFIPNEAQENAIRHVNGPLFLPAGPGSGKTRVLLWRALNLIVFHNVKPSEIFLSTFTEKAALQLKEGLQSLLGFVTSIIGQPFDLSTMYIGTVHSLCRRIINEKRLFCPQSHRIISPGLMDELDQYFFISRNRIWSRLLSVLNLQPDLEGNERINQIFDSFGSSKHRAVLNCISFFNRAAEEIIGPDQAIERLQQPDNELSSHLINYNLDCQNIIDAFKLFKQYQILLETSGDVPRVDFAHLQQAAYRVLLESEHATEVFKHVIVDEYQDTNTIQEMIFFRLAQSHHNICVVGDDDQALYRFRGATVENFVDFPNRCLKYLSVETNTIPLSLNYRSRSRIVDFYSQFIDQEDWRSSEGNFYRVTDKKILAAREDLGPAVAASSCKEPEEACKEIAVFVKSLLAQEKVQDPNQIAFLFPSLKSVHVQTMAEALQDQGLSVYAPRAHSFLDTDEAMDVFGLLTLILGRPDLRGRGFGGDFDNFRDWIYRVENIALELTECDPNLAQFVNDKKSEIDRACSDYETLISVVEKERWDLHSNYSLGTMKRKLYSASRLSETGKKIIGSGYLDNYVKFRINRGDPLPLEYIITRTTSLDWSILDLFYRLSGFNHFKSMFDLAQEGLDEGPICNLSLISQYLSRFVEDFIPMITAKSFLDKTFHRVFFFTYLFALFRLAESEYENTKDPFPKGRIPFLTIHQAKGLEFPVVVLGNPYRRRHNASFTECAVRPFIVNKEGEPLDRIPDFDTARMFYVALSRAENFLLIAHYKGRPVDASIKNLLTDNFPRLTDISLGDFPIYKFKPKKDLPQMYSYTSDYLHYKKCPRQYMIFRKYDFVPSRAQTMFFGSLVHQTLDDLHHELIRRREGSSQS